MATAKETESVQLRINEGNKSVSSLEAMISKVSSLLPIFEKSVTKLKQDVTNFETKYADYLGNSLVAAEKKQLDDKVTYLSNSVTSSKTWVSTKQASVTAQKKDLADLQSLVDSTKSSK